MFEDTLLPQKEIVRIVNVFTGEPYRSEIAIAEAVANAQHLATLKAVREYLDEHNSLIRHESCNYPDHCGLLLTLERWQALKKSMEE